MFVLFGLISFIFVFYLAFLLFKRQFAVAIRILAILFVGVVIVGVYLLIKIDINQAITALAWLAVSYLLGVFAGFYYYNFSCSYIQNNKVAYFFLFAVFVVVGLAILIFSFGKATACIN